AVGVESLHGRHRGFLEWPERGLSAHGRSRAVADAAGRRGNRMAARPAAIAQGAARMKTRDGFTLLELLVSMAVIAVLSVLMLSALAKIRSIGQSAFCANSLRQLGVVTQLDLSDHDRRMFPYSQAVE